MQLYRKIWVNLGFATNFFPLEQCDTNKKIYFYALVLVIKCYSVPISAEKEYFFHSDYF